MDRQPGTTCERSRVTTITKESRHTHASTRLTPGYTCRDCNDVGLARPPELVWPPASLSYATLAVARAPKSEWHWRHRNSSPIWPSKKELPD